MEEAKAYKKLLEEEDLTQEGLAQALGQSRASVANHLRLLVFGTSGSTMDFGGSSYFQSGSGNFES